MIDRLWGHGPRVRLRFQRRARIAARVETKQSHGRAVEPLDVLGRQRAFNGVQYEWAAVGEQQRPVGMRERQVGLLRSE